MNSFQNCLLSFIFCLAYSLAASAQALTYNKDIAPIIRQNCASCHKPGEAAPFSLLTYEDVVKRTTFIKKVIQDRYMPPWKADNGYRHFANDRSLSDETIQKLVSWIDQQVPRGRHASASSLAKPVLNETNYYRKPDLYLQPDSAFLVKGENIDRFVIFKIPFALPDSANVEAIEFISNNKKLIHHANFAIHPVDDSVDIENAVKRIDLTVGDRRQYGQYLPFRKKISYYGGWIPGTSIESYPENFGWVFPKRGVMLLTVHYSPTAKDTEVISGVNFFFTKRSISRRVKVISFGSGGIGEKDIQPSFTFIPPNKVSKFTLDVTNPSEDQSVLYIWPHMHLLGKEFRAYAISPEADTIPLVHIPQWDFRWQEIYRVEKLIKVPRGSVIHIEGDYDNTADNPMNPNDPPEGIFSWGDMKTNQEMLTLILVFLPYKKGDEALDINVKN
ncbi:MAG TPA: cytochrome c [Flavitalea sp.]|nr:cytochrome c [Flavitalea sp.]